MSERPAIQPRRGSATFRQRDLEAAIRAVKKSGETRPFRVDIEGDKVSVTIGLSESDDDTSLDPQEAIRRWQP